MANAMVIIGNANMKPGAGSPEGAAAEYFHNRISLGSFAFRPPVEKWNKDQRKRFEKELERLETENAAQKESAGRQAVARPIEANLGPRA